MKIIQKVSVKRTYLFFAVLFLSSFNLLAIENPKAVNLLSSQLPSVHSLLTNNMSDKDVTVAKKRQSINQVSISRRTIVDTIKRKLVARQQVKQTYKLRNATPEKSSQAYGFEFYSVSSYLNSDLDGDGFYSDFTLDFDVDYDNGYADIYAVLYYSYDGGPWIEYYITDVVTIFNDDSADSFSINSTLNSDFPTGEYDILIDLYEQGSAGIVASISSEEVNDLSALPLEDQQHESNSQQGQISYIASSLSGDYDADEFYTDLTLEYDIDSVYSGDTVYTEVVLTNRDEGWYEVLSTEYFTLESQTEFVDLTFNSGFPAGWYDIEVNVIHRFTKDVIATAGSEFSSLVSLPIESVDNDNYSEYTTHSTQTDVVVTGSFSWIVILFAFMVLVFRQENS